MRAVILTRFRVSWQSLDWLEMNIPSWDNMVIEGKFTFQLGVNTVWNLPPYTRCKSLPDTVVCECRLDWLAKGCSPYNTFGISRHMNSSRMVPKYPESRYVEPSSSGRSNGRSEGGDDLGG